MQPFIASTLAVVLLACLAVSCSPPPPAPQAPVAGEFENLQFFTKDITRPELIQHMRSFSFALGVRCQYCHTGGDGISFDGVVFPSDEKPAKRKARAMLQMVADLNSRTLTALPERREPRVEVGCVTCHRSLPIPMTLAIHLKEIVASDGAAAAVARYRELRETSTLSGQYDFGEWSMNELARALGEAGDTASAIAILEMNAEFYPRSSAIDIGLAELHATRGERDRAVARFRLALEKDPENQRAKTRLAELGR